MSEAPQFTVDPQVARQLPAEFCRMYQVILLTEGKMGVMLGMAQPDNPLIVQEVERQLQKRVKPVPMRAWDIERALSSVFRPKIDPGSAQLQVLARRYRVDARASATDLLAGVVGDAIERGATDIHLERFVGASRVRYRIDGLLHAMRGPPPSPQQFNELVARIKVLAELDVAEHRATQDGRFSVYAGGDEPVLIDVRVAILPGPDGEDVVLRLLRGGGALVDFATLGMSDEDIATVEGLIRNPEGLILVTGPTGAGKTTTLYAALAELADGTRKIMTAEDPIEYRLPFVNQKQASPKMSLADLARGFLRADPDVLLIGEIRDEETARIAASAAQTGHLVFSTLHLNQAINAPQRLHTLGLDYDTIAPSLLCVVSQRLIRQNCPDCTVPQEPDPAILARVPGAEGLPRLFRGKGCESCQGTGYMGRVGVFEILYVDEALSDVLQRGAPRGEIRQLLRERGHRSMRHDALRKLARGLTSLEEVYRTIPKRVLDDT